MIPLLSLKRKDLPAQEGFLYGRPRVGLRLLSSSVAGDRERAL
jgi:hypothetical protein